MSSQSETGNGHRRPQLLRLFSILCLLSTLRPPPWLREEGGVTALHLLPMYGSVGGGACRVLQSSFTKEASLTVRSLLASLCHCVFSSRALSWCHNRTNRKLKNTDRGRREGEAQRGRTSPPQVYEIAQAIDLAALSHLPGVSSLAGGAQVITHVTAMSGGWITEGAEHSPLSQTSSASSQFSQVCVMTSGQLCGRLYH